MVKTFLCMFALCGGCQGRDLGTAAGSASEPERDARGGDVAAEPDARPAGVEDAKPDDNSEPPDPGASIVDLGAIPAWQAVIDRAQLLGRRNQRGVVYGRIGTPIAAESVDAGYVWLVDDSDGNGSLGIRVALGGKSVKPGARVAIGGAWQLDASHRWFWRTESIQALPPAPASDLKDPEPAEPGHTIANGNLPQGARTIGVARDGDAVYFQIVGPAPTNDGDGWLVANELGDTPVALLTLPGERASYGAQDMRGADERWQLRKAQTYWVRIGKIRKRGLDKPALIHARTAPVRVN